MKRPKHPSHERLSLGNAVYLYSRVEHMEEEQDFDLLDMVTTLTEITEVLVWGDKHAESLFDTIMERGFMSLLERIVTNGQLNTAVKVNTLKCVTMLLTNLTRASSYYFVCSNDHLNRMIAIQFDENDHEFLSMYVSFLKSLAIRLNNNTVHFFFESSRQSFPLFDRAIEMLTSEDTFIRTAARQIVITLAQLEATALEDFLLINLVRLFTIVAQYISAQLVKLGQKVPWSCRVASMNCKEMAKGGSSTTINTMVSVGAAEGSAVGSSCDSLFSPTLVQQATEDIVDDLFYVNDLSRIPQPNVAEHLVEVLKEQLIQPLAATVERELRDGAGDTANGAAGPSTVVSPLGGVPADTILFFVARWLRVNNVAPIHQCLSDYFGCIHISETIRLPSKAASSPGTAGCLLMRILITPRVDLYGAAIEVLHTMLMIESSGTTEESISISPSSPIRAMLTRERDRVHSSDSVTPVCGSSSEVNLQSLDDFVVNAFASIQDALAIVDGEDHLLRLVLCSLYYQIVFPDLCRLTTLRITMKCLDMCLQRLPVKLGRQKEAHCSLLTEVAHLCTAGLGRRFWGNCGHSHVDNNTGDAYGGPPTSMGEEVTRNSSSSPSTPALQDSCESFFLHLKQAWDYFELHRDSITGACDTLDTSCMIPLAPQLTPSRYACPFHSDRPDRSAVTGYVERRMCVNSEQYSGVQRLVFHHLPLYKRCAMTSIESILLELLSWMVIREHIHQLGGDSTSPDTLAERLRAFRARTAAGSVLRFHYSPDAFLMRCELMGMTHLHGGIKEPKHPSERLNGPGTAMYMAFSPTELLFLRAPIRVSAERVKESKDRIMTGSLLYCFDLAYVTAHIPASGHFQVVVSCANRNYAVQLRLACPNPDMAGCAVNAMTYMAQMCRRRGAGLCAALLQCGEEHRHLH